MALPAPAQSGSSTYESRPDEFSLTVLTQLATTARRTDGHSPIAIGSLCRLPTNWTEA